MLLSRKGSHVCMGKFMKNVMQFFLVFIIGVGLAAAAPAHAKMPSTVPDAAQSGADSTDATNIVKDFYSQLLDTMKQGDQLGFAGRYKKLEPAIKNAFNLPLMTRFAVGLSWSNATSEEQQQLVSAFSDFSVATYASQFKSWDGESFEIQNEKPSTEGVIVETQLKQKSGDPVTLNYLMRKDDQGKWRIVDVFLDGAISELAARRSEFSSIVRRDGINALVNSLGTKAKQMGPS